MHRKKTGFYTNKEYLMADCALLAKCIFFNDKMASVPVAADMMKKRYCLKDNTNCARFVVCSALGREQVPADLFPNHTDRAKTLIAKTSR
jgi:hypothetical protein